MSRVRAFPWATLDALTKAEVARARHFGDFIAHLLATSTSARAATLRGLLGVSPEVRLRAIDSAASASAPDDERLAVHLLVAKTEVIVETESALAADVVARALERKGPSLPPRGTAALAGAFGAVAVSALRRLRADADVRLKFAGLSKDVLARQSLADPVAAHVTVLLDADAYDARLVFSSRAAGSVGARPVGRRALAALDVRIAVPLTLAPSWAPARELRALATGDVWLTGGRSTALSFVLAAPGARRGVRCTATAGLALGVRDVAAASFQVVVGDVVEDLTMSEATEDTLLESALDAPVIVRVELGAVELSAREWASLRAGDVVTVGARVGAPVLLRAGSRELGTGELVDIDGEVGVRVLSMRTSTPQSASLEGGA